MADDTLSCLPYSAYQSDKDFITIPFSTFRGHRIICTDDTVSLPFRIFQIDSHFGYNRTVMLGPIYGKLTDELGRLQNSLEFEYGSGMHVRSFGNKFETMGELQLCYGKPRRLETDTTNYEFCKKIRNVLSVSCLTMHGGPGKSYEQFYDRNISKLITGVYRASSKKSYSFLSGGRISFKATSSYNCSTSMGSVYDEVATGTYKANSNIESSKKSIDILATDDVVITTENGVVYVRGNYVKIESINDCEITSYKNLKIKAVQMELEAAELITMNAPQIHLNSEIYIPIDIPYVEEFDPPCPQVRITRGYDEISEDLKAIDSIV